MARPLVHARRPPSPATSPSSRRGRATAGATSSIARPRATSTRCAPPPAESPSPRSRSWSTSGARRRSDPHARHLRAAHLPGHALRQADRATHREETITMKMVAVTTLRDAAGAEVAKEMLSERGIAVEIAPRQQRLLRLPDGRGVEVRVPEDALVEAQRCSTAWTRSSSAPRSPTRACRPSTTTSAAATTCRSPSCARASSRGRWRWRSSDRCPAAASSTRAPSAWLHAGGPVAGGVRRLHGRRRPLSGAARAQGGRRVVAPFAARASIASSGASC